MNIYTASEHVKRYFSQSINKKTTVQTSKVYGINDKATILRFESESQANDLGGGGYLFKCTYKDGKIDIVPIN